MKCMIYLVVINIGVIGLSALATGQDVVIHQNEIEEVQVSVKPVILTTSNIPASVVFVLVQVHSHFNSLTLSLDEEAEESRYTNGSDIGVLLEVPVGSTDASCFVRCTSCTGDRNATVIAMATYLTSSDPVPGACNTEFQLENDPNIHIVPKRFINPVQFQFANFGKERGKKFPVNCEDKKQESKLRYDVYQLFFHSTESSEKSFLDSMRLVLNRTEFLQKAQKIATMQGDTSKPEVYFESYYGHGVAYAVVVSQNNTSSVTSALYVPIITYDCEANMDGTCDTRTAAIVTLKVVSTFLAVAGAALCFAGHRLIKISMFTFGLLAFTLIFLTVLFRFTPWNVMTVVLSSLSLGAVGGALWLAVWFFLGSPMLSVLIPGLVLGYLLASIVFVTSPLGNFTFMQSLFSYGTCFGCAVLVPCLLMVFSRQLHIVSCTFVGSFLVIFAFDQFIYGNLQRIIMVSLKRTFSSEFLKVHSTWPPFTISDIILSVSWVVLCVSGMAVQYYRERGRSPFPQCPYQKYKMQRESTSTPGPNRTEEHDPLLQPGSSPQTLGVERRRADHEVSPSRGSVNQSPGTYGATSRGLRRTNDVSGFYEES